MKASNPDICPPSTGQGRDITLDLASLKASVSNVGLFQLLEVSKLNA
jgi:hypothetical protein